MAKDSSVENLSEMIFGAPSAPPLLSDLGQATEHFSEVPIVELELVYKPVAR
jgi:hypothetical protein